jgi:uncharacterized protein (TIGR01589 family)
MGAGAKRKKKMDPVASAEATCDGIEKLDSREPTSLEDTVVSGRASASRKGEEPQNTVSTFDIQLVQSLVERCLQLYMNQREVLSILQQQAKIEPSFTALVWQKLEEQNPEFFSAYYLRLRLKDQITVFNHLIERHHSMLRSRSHDTSMHNDIMARLHDDSAQLGTDEVHQEDASVGPPRAVDERGMEAREAKLQDSAFDLRNPYNIRETSNHALGTASGLCEKETVIPIQHSVCGAGVVSSKVENTFHNSFDNGAGVDSDGLMGGLNAFPRNFSLSDLTVDLQQSCEDEQTLSFLGSFPLQEGDDAGVLDL